MKICIVVAELWNADGQENMTVVMVALPNFANAPKKPRLHLLRVTNTKLLNFYFPPVAGNFKYTFVPCRAMLSLPQHVRGFRVVWSCVVRYELYTITKCMSVVFIQWLRQC
jgi:hypothetical protein